MQVSKQVMVPTLKNSPIKLHDFNWIYMCRFRVLRALLWKQSR